MCASGLIPANVPPKLLRFDSSSQQQTTIMMRSRRIGAVIEEQKALKDEIGVSSQFCLMDLPTPVLHDILFRLPINSIIKVRLVCTELYKLISHPDFALNYTKISPFATLLGTANLCEDTSTYVNLCKDTCTYENLNLVEVCDSNESCIRTAFKPKIHGVSGFELVGACNGLLCLSVRKWRTEIVYVCNPIMGEYMSLPERKLERDGEREYGFGFCTSTNNYKVLRIVWKPYPANKEGELFTIGIDDTWRVLAIPEFPFFCFSGDIVALNGAFHWFFMGNGSTWICTFDLGEEEIGQLSNPHGFVLNCFHMKLKSISNQLCLLDFSDPYVMVLWKMKEYGLAESWTKDIILDTSLTSELLRCRSHFPETILQNGDIVFSSESGNYLVSYNPTKRKVTQIQVRCNGTITYTPNFLSLKEALVGEHQSTMNL